MKEYGKVIYIGIGLVAILLSYFLGFQNFQTKNAELQEEVDETQSKCDTLKSEYANKDKYIKETKEFDNKYEELLGRFDTTLLNEGQIMDLYNMQGECNVEVTSATFTEPTETYAFDGSLTTPEMIAQQNATNPDGTPVEAEPIITTTAIDSSYRGVSDTLTFTVRGDYPSVKAALQKVMDGKKRKVPSSLAFTYDSTDEKVMCNIILTEYAITGNDREAGKVTIPDSAIGRDNIFFNPLGTAAQNS